MPAPSTFSISMVTASKTFFSRMKLNFRSRSGRPRSDRISVGRRDGRSPSAPVKEPARQVNRHPCAVRTFGSKRMLCSSPRPIRSNPVSRSQVSLPLKRHHLCHQTTRSGRSVYPRALRSNSQPPSLRSSIPPLSNGVPMADFGSSRCATILLASMAKGSPEAW